jgi:CNT family concentrative nucleoside transporter
MPWLQLQSAFGLIVLVLVAWAMSEDRRAAFSWRLVVAALGLQIGLALLLLQVPYARGALYSLNGVVDALSTATQAGTSFVFGFVGGGAAPFEVTKAQNLGSLASKRCRWCW